MGVWRSILRLLWSPERHLLAETFDQFEYFRIKGALGSVGIRHRTVFSGTSAAAERRSHRGGPSTILYRIYISSEDEGRAAKALKR
ncbi:hypothetical protein KIH86_26035 [Paenibacillus sp. HN-1]|uniref:hypothetical protein n=1 Tax=Paenibacillus TaxID=44249 RepID=UPI001CA94985|nr:MULTISPECIES: hypothetical protein [Paenibacillus]MBY9081529.1 hypothetical protein [Paenibacillus sp. CGMCC 1.18879]MBY9087652.1 hypothetical protein [Paenibacillus sinensis]